LQRRGQQEAFEGEPIEWQSAGCDRRREAELRTGSYLGKPDANAGDTRLVECLFLNLWSQAL